jgi:hypothetical protein
VYVQPTYTGQSLFLSSSKSPQSTKPINEKEDADKVEEEDDFDDE